jgi:hypothetical protein
VLILIAAATAIPAHAQDRRAPAVEARAAVLRTTTRLVDFRTPPVSRRICIDCGTLGIPLDPQPLIFVDGRRVTSMELRAIDQNQIATIQFVKPRRAMHQYGAAAVNGAVLIRLKREGRQ